MPQLEDQNFSRTVILVCQHDQKGAFGIVINRISEHRLGEVFAQLGIAIGDLNSAERPLFEGGPIARECGLILHSTEPDRHSWQSTFNISQQIALTSSRDIVEDIASGKGPDKYLMSLGYAGWGAAQLEQEIMQNAWFSTPVEQAILFDTDCDLKWYSVAASIGIDYTKLSAQMGHA